MLALQLPPEIEKRLDELAARTGRSKGAHALEAVLTYIEDMEDAYLAQQALDEGGERISLEDVMKKYGLEQEA